MRLHSFLRGTSRLGVLSLVILGLPTAQAGSATWALNPISNQWQTAENWTPPTVPHNVSDTATFGPSNTTNVAIGVPGPGFLESETFLDKIVFAPGAPSYTITVTPDGEWGVFFSIEGGGVINDSGVEQNIVVGASPNSSRSGELLVTNQATISDDVIITNQGAVGAEGDGAGGGSTSLGIGLLDSPRAGNATFVNEGGTVDGAFGGATVLASNATAERATFISNPGTVSGAGGGETIFYTSASGNMGSSTFICNAATVPGAEAGAATIEAGGDGGGVAAGAAFIAKGAALVGAEGGQVLIEGGRGQATFVAAGGTAQGAAGGVIDLFNYIVGGALYSDQTFLIAQAGMNGGLGGTILVENADAQEMSRFQVFGNGLLDLRSLLPKVTLIGSLEGTGLVNLGGHGLILGNNNIDTTFSGLMEGRGLVEKVGTGTLTLSGANTYAGGTTLSAGGLKVSNTTGSATGAGAMKVNMGTLSGRGTIAGTVTVGAGSGPGAFLAPSGGSHKPAILTIQSALTFKSDGTYTYKLNTKRAKADQIIANGVAIESGAQFVVGALADQRLRYGTVFTVINNTAAMPIAGTFANLPGDATVTVGNNTFQADYQGGDGNDLTLIVVP
ncbi:MAG: autotransporter-associated beta strand repeat-containing protein [Chthoniobacterales bacterium]|nr:autotransporter-associated beta strand repeat-containing protein [Chthoniobacterales bacterium]